MHSRLAHRSATLTDLPALVELLRDDELGAARDPPVTPADGADDPRHAVLSAILANPSEYLMVVVDSDAPESVLAMCHLRVLRCLSNMGSSKLTVEAVRVASAYRSLKVGSWMIQQAEAWGAAHGARSLELSTHKSRTRAQQFYTRLGFVGSHEGMKKKLMVPPLE